MKKLVISLLLFAIPAGAQTSSPQSDPLMQALEAQGQQSSPQNVRNFRNQNQVQQAQPLSRPVQPTAAPAAPAQPAAQQPVSQSGQIPPPMYPAQGINPGVAPVDPGSATTQPAAAAPKAPRPKPTPKPEPAKLTKEESDLLKARFKSLKDRPDLTQDEATSIAPTTKNAPIYVPAPTRDKSNDGFLVDRDTAKVVKRRMSVDDSLTVKICFSSGIQITLDESIATTFQTIMIDDPVMFGAVSLDNNRGAYVRLKMPVPEGQYTETALRLIRKSDDKTYLINIYGLPCPAGPYPYPKTIYLQDKIDNFTKNTTALTPEDTIISISGGLPRIKKNRITVYDMVTNSGSKWVVFGVEVQFPNRGTKKFDADFSKYFKVLDNLQVQEIQTKIQYLPLQSDKATKSRGISTMRFKITMNIDKNYMLNNRYIYLMYVDKEEGHYQYVPIDTLPYFLSLKNRGFEL